MDKTSKVLGSLVLPGVVMVLAIGLLFAFSNLSLAQQGIGWPALPDSSTPPVVKPSPAPSVEPSPAPLFTPAELAKKADDKKVVEAPASPVVTSTPSVVTPTPSPSLSNSVANGDDDGDDDGGKKKIKKGKGHLKGKGKGHEKHGD